MNTFIMLALAGTLMGAGEPPKVRYLSKTESRSWEPIKLDEVNRVVEAAVLGALTPAGMMRLEKAAGFGELVQGEYTLLIEGRFVEEAESYSLYLTFGPGTEKDLPSFHVFDTAAIGRRERSKMIASIEGTARRAGLRLGEVLNPQLERVRIKLGRPNLDNTELPFQWEKLSLPSVGSPKSWIKTLLDVREPDHERFGALEKIKSQIFDQAAARDAAMRCALRDPKPELRAACVRALEPAARTHVPTQRLLLQALREEADETVMGPLLDISKIFVGLSKKETIDTWLELAASSATPASSASSIGQLLSKEGDVPNLDVAVAKCLRQEALDFGKKYACIQWLLPKIPEERRFGVVYGYLLEAGFEYGDGQLAFDSLLDLAIGRGSQPIAPEYAELLLSIVERPAPVWMRRRALFAMERHPAPSPALLERLLRQVESPGLANTVLEISGRIVRRAPELAGMAVGALERIRATTRFMPQNYGGDANETLTKTLNAVKTLHSKN